MGTVAVAVSDAPARVMRLVSVGGLGLSRHLVALFHYHKELQHPSGAG